MLAGGVDLIGKPFITFEITVKALTMVLRRRLDLAEVRIPARNIPVAEAQSRTVEEPVLAKRSEALSQRAICLSTGSDRFPTRVSRPVASERSATPQTSGLTNG